jgi:hypothetical protein
MIWYARPSRRGSEEKTAPNLTGPIGGSETGAGLFWMIEQEGVWYALPVWEDLILVYSKRVGTA